MLCVNMVCLCQNALHVLICVWPFSCMYCVHYRDMNTTVFVFVFVCLYVFGLVFMCLSKVIVFVFVFWTLKHRGLGAVRMYVFVCFKVQIACNVRFVYSFLFAFICALCVSNMYDGHFCVLFLCVGNVIVYGNV